MKPLVIVMSLNLHHHIFIIKIGNVSKTSQVSIDDNRFLANLIDEDLIISNVLDMIKSLSFQLARNRS